MLDVCAANSRLSESCSSHVPNRRWSFKGQSRSMHKLRHPVWPHAQQVFPHLSEKALETWCTVLCDNRFTFEKQYSHQPKTCHSHNTSWLFWTQMIAQNTQPWCIQIILFTNSWRSDSTLLVQPNKWKIQEHIHTHVMQMTRLSKEIAPWHLSIKGRHSFWYSCSPPPPRTQ